MNNIDSLHAKGDARVHVGNNYSNVHNHYAASGLKSDIERELERKERERYRERIKALRLEFIERLNTTPCEERKNRNAKRAKGTCEWFTAHHLFQNWQRETSAPLWVSADPGCGKSVLARYLVDEILPSNAMRKTCYFFFKDDFDDQRTAEGALRCILHQLLVQEPVLLSEETLLQYEGEKDQYLSSFWKLWSLLVEVADKREHGEIVCVLDALDECEGHTPLTEALTQLYSQSRTPSGLKFILTSRPYRKHQREFHELVQSQPTIHLRGDGQEEADKIAAEITIAIQRRTDDLCRRFPIFLHERQFLEKEITKVEHRTYLWVVLLFNHLENAVFHNKYELRNCIHDLPHTVEEAYEKILQKSADPIKAKKVLHFIMAAERPLLLVEMAAMLALREDHQCHRDLERDILVHDSLSFEIREACGLFVIINDLKVYLLHQTAREFLLQAPGQLSAPGWQHSIDTQISHRIISKLCIQYLWFPELQELMYDPRRPQPFVLLEYAAQNWTFHYRQARDTDAHLQSLALQLCDPYLAMADIWMAAHIEREFGERAVRHALFELSTSLLIVAYFGMDDLVNRVLKQGKFNSLNDKSPKSLRTALSWAAERGHDRVVRLLLDRVPDWQVRLRDRFHTRLTTIVNRKDADNRTPLGYATRTGHTVIAQQLADKGAHFWDMRRRC